MHRYDVIMDMVDRGVPDGDIILSVKGLDRSTLAVYHKAHDGTLTKIVRPPYVASKYDASARNAKLDASRTYYSKHKTDIGRKFREYYAAHRDEILAKQRERRRRESGR